MSYVTPFTGRRKCIGFPHLLSLRNVAHSANDGTAVYFLCSDYGANPAAPSLSRHLGGDFAVGFGIDHKEVGLGSHTAKVA